MSSIKEHFFEIQSERADEWIRERLDDQDADEESEEWQELANEYGNYQDHLMEEAEFKAELEWLRENGSSLIHKFFIGELDALKKITDDNLSNNSNMAFLLNNQLIFKMSYAYAVTLLEAFLGDSLKSLISEYPKYLANAIANVDELKKARFSLSELSASNIEVSSLAIRKISELLFHNIPKAKLVYEKVLGKKLNIDISKIVKVTDVRHNIVHRNGATLDNESITITITDLDDAISHIKKFAEELQSEINSEITA
jgi:hypothetical protein